MALVRLSIFQSITPACSNMLFLGIGFVLAGAGDPVSAVRKELPV
jgi:hypothetical protein